MESSNINCIRQQSTICDVHVGHEVYIKQHSQMYRLEIYSHANMLVVGKGAHVEYIGKTVGVKAFSPTYETAPLPVVGAVIQYECSHSVTLTFL